MPVDDVIQSLIQKSLEELSDPKNPKQTSRTWQSPNAYRYLVQWSNSVLLRYLIRLFTISLPKLEYRRKAQLDDAARSVVRNIEEGWKRINTATYLEFVGFSQGSLEEVKGDIRELTEDGFLPSKLGSGLSNIGIDLSELNISLKPKDLKDTKGSLEEVIDEAPSGNPKYIPRSFTIKPVQNYIYTPLDVLYPPLKHLKAQDLTHEIFIELINKTDFLLRKLVESLELKLINDRKGYEVQKSKIREAIKKK